MTKGERKIKIKVVLTDLGNVVIVSAHVVTHAYLVEHGVPYAKAKRFFSIPEYADFARGRISETDFYRAILGLIGVDWDMFEIQHAHDVHMFAVNDDVPEILKEASRDLRLAVVTDTNVWQTRRVEEELLRGQWITSRRFLRSDEIGQLKQEPGTFDLYARLLEEEPESILFIDDRDDLCRLAQEGGFQTHRFENSLILQQELRLRGLISP
jgi:FMN phosphatase YigB (HAD superfamily)